MGDNDKEQFKYYGVAIGKKPGIYTTWGQTQKQVNKFSGNVYEGFVELNACVQFMLLHSSIPESDIQVYDERARGTSLSEYDDYTEDEIGPEETNPKEVTSVRKTGRNVDKITCILNPVLAYSVYGLLNGSAANVRAAVLGYFTADQINEAKDVLWENCDQSVIGTKYLRREGTVTSKVEANVGDIFKALQKLDSEEKMPDIGVSSKDLGNIPQSHPEELNNISLVDRLNTMEKRLTKFQEVLDRTVCENMELKDKVDKITPTFASAVSNNAISSSGGNVIEIRPHLLPHIPVRAASAIVKERDNGGDTRNSNLSIPQSNQGTNNERSGSTQHDYRLQSLHRSGSTHSVQSDLSGYQLQPHQRKYQQRQQRKIVTGNITTSQAFRGAPEPSRELFIQRVSKNTTTEDVKQYVTNKSFTVREICMMSHQDAKYNSFKITVPVSEFTKLFDPDLWPSGVRIRQFRTHQSRKQDDVDTTSQWRR